MERRLPESVRLTKLQNEKRLPSNTEDGALEQSEEIEARFQLFFYSIDIVRVELY